METAITRHGKGNEPAWSIKRRGLNAGAKPLPWYLSSGGALSRAAPRGATGADSYDYPRPAPDVRRL